MKSALVTLEVLLFSAAGLAFQTIVLTALGTDALPFVTALLFLSPLANGIILSLIGEPASVHRARGARFAVLATSAALAISVVVALGARLFAPWNSAAFVASVALIAQQIATPARRISYSTRYCHAFSLASSLGIWLAALCFFGCLSVHTYMLFVCITQIAAVLFCIAAEHFTQSPSEYRILHAARTYGLPLVPSVFLAWIPIGLTGLILTAVEPSAGVYFKAVLNFVIPIQVLVAANQARLIALGPEAVSPQSRRRSLFLAWAVFLGTAVVLASDRIYLLVYGSPPDGSIFVVTAIFALSMVAQYRSSLYGVQLRFRGRTLDISKGYGVGAIAALPAVMVAWAFKSPTAGAVAILMSALFLLAYMRRAASR